MSASALSPKPVSLPGIGSIWQHSKGTFYRVALVSRHSENPNQWLISYEPVAGGDAWTRTFIQNDENRWPGFMDVLDDAELTHRFRHVSGPRSWKDEPERPSYDDLLELLDNVSASFENVMTQFKGQMYRADREERTKRVDEARATCDRLLRH